MTAEGIQRRIVADAGGAARRRLRWAVASAALVVWSSAGWAQDPGRGVTPAPHAIASVPDGPLASVKLRLDEGNFRVEISGDGVVAFEGRMNVLASGRHVAHIDPKAVARLVAEFRDAGFWSLPDDDGVVVSDAPSRELSLEIGGKSETVAARTVLTAGRSAVIADLAKQVVEQSGAERWISGNAETVASLRDEQFDFRTPQAAGILAAAAEAGGAAGDRVAIDFLRAGASPLGRAPPHVTMLGMALGRPPTPMEAAVRRRDLVLLQALLEAGAPLEVNAGDGGALLADAAAAGSTPLVKAVLATGPDVNIASASGETALTGAEAFGASGQGDSAAVRMEIAGMLLAHGADPNRPNAAGDRPLHLAPDREMVRLLLNHGANLEGRNALGETPIWRNPSDSAVAAMIEAGADVTVVGPPPESESFQTRAERRHLTASLEAMRRRIPKGATGRP